MQSPRQRPQKDRARAPQWPQQQPSQSSRRGNCISKEEIADLERAQRENRLDSIILHLWDLPLRASVAAIREIFHKFGEINRIDLKTNENQIPNGQAFITFRPAPQDLSFLRRPLHFILPSKKILMPNGAPERLNFRLLANRSNTRPRRGTNMASMQSNSTLDCAEMRMGVLLDEQTFVNEWSATDDVQFCFGSPYENIEVFFALAGKRFRLVFKLKHISGMIKVERNYDPFADGDPAARKEERVIKLVMSSDIPPYVWTYDPNLDVGDQTRLYDRAKLWKRVTGISLVKLTKEQKLQPINIYPTDSAVAIGHWTTYQFVIPIDTAPNRFWASTLLKLSQHKLLPRKPELTTFELVNKKDPRRLALSAYRQGLSTEVSYLVESCISYGIFCIDNLTDEFYGLLAKIPPSHAVQILTDLQANQKRVWSPLKTLEQTYKEYAGLVPSAVQFPSYNILMKKILITPTRCYFLPPTVETTNRVIRHFWQYRDHFIRVAFTDEGFRAFGLVTTSAYDPVFNRIFSVLRNGIQIGARHFEFLAFSASQLRENSCWFFNSVDGITADSIRCWLGDFSDIKVAAKYAARMGQCFSSTRAVYNLKVDEVIEVPDITRNGFTFSDGIGRISPELAKVVIDSLELPERTSAFQIRLGGCKGVLCVSPHVKGSQIHIRSSQKKFSSPHSDLEICGYARYAPCYLNRQIIILLRDLGIADQAFHNLKRAMVHALDLMFEDPQVAITTLLRNVESSGVGRFIADIVEGGFLEKMDPFVLNMLRLFRAMMLRELKTKARIFVPQGALLMGVMDETLRLPENCVFLQITDPESPGKRRVITGPLIVTRNPCLHPGDIRVATAVDEPLLHHLVDCVAFSTQGYRDLPNMCAGGDLDGDQYTLIWDQDLIPSGNAEPMSCETPAPVNLASVTVSDIQKFFVNYIISDNLGTLSNAHLAQADLNEHGTRSGICIRLAHLCSMAVDFPKTGRPAVPDDDLRPKRWPDFMEKSHLSSDKVYRSEKILGQLYRSVILDDFKPQMYYILDERIIAPGFEKYLNDAKRFKRHYDRDLLSLMNQYGIASEGEFLTGYVINFEKLTSVRKKEYDFKARKAVVDAADVLRKKYRKLFAAEFQSISEAINKAELDAEMADNDEQRSTTRSCLSENWKTNPILSTEIEAKAVAWYFITYMKPKDIENATRRGKRTSEQERIEAIVSTTLAAKQQSGHSRSDELGATSPTDNATATSPSDATVTPPTDDATSTSPVQTDLETPASEVVKSEESEPTSFSAETAEAVQTLPVPPVTNGSDCEDSRTTDSSKLDTPRTASCEGSISELSKTQDEATDCATPSPQPGGVKESLIDDTLEPAIDSLPAEAEAPSKEEEDATETTKSPQSNDASGKQDPYELEDDFELESESEDEAHADKVYSTKNNFMSFPWIVHDVLCHVARKEGTGQRTKAASRMLRRLENKLAKTGEGGKNASEDGGSRVPSSNDANGDDHHDDKQSSMDNLTAQERIKQMVELAELEMEESADGGEQDDGKIKEAFSALEKDYVEEDDWYNRYQRKYDQHLKEIQLGFSQTSPTDPSLARKTTEASNKHEESTIATSVDEIADLFAAL